MLKPTTYLLEFIISDDVRGPDHVHAHARGCDHARDHVHGRDHDRGRGYGHEKIRSTPHHKSEILSQVHQWYKKTPQKPQKLQTSHYIVVLSQVFDF